MSNAKNIHSSADARRLARARLPRMIFDYIDGAAGEGRGMRRTRQALDAIELRSRILCDVSQRSLSASLFDNKTKRPFGIAPMGMCNLSAPGADLMLARLAARHEVPLCVSTVASTPLETLIEEANGNAWFQLYFSGDGTSSFKLVERARNAGYEHLILTVDVPEIGRRPRELRHGFKMPFHLGPKQFLDFALHPRWSISSLIKGRPEMANFAMAGFEFDRTESRAKADWALLEKLREAWSGKLIVKGVLDVEDAIRLEKAGVDAIQVSSHGARQLESAPTAIAALPKIREALNPDFPLFYDSAVRSGEDVLKAFNSGANFVFLGRILQFAIAAAGEEGLERLWDIISQELSIAMAMTGRTKL